jgi:hypothetical protein
MKGTIEHSSITEEQAIKITIEKGYNGSEYKTAAWKQRQCLKPDRTLSGLIGKLETIYNHVEFVGTGKKRKYILKDKKNEVSEREFNYKGSIPTHEDEVMTEYIFNHLLNYTSDYTKAYKGWAKEIGFINPNSLIIEDMIKVIKDLHYGINMIYNPNEVVSIFLQTLNVRNKDIIEKSFQRLEKDNRIKVTEIYNIKDVDGQYKTITQTEYNTFTTHIGEFLKQYDVSYYAYTQSLNSIHKTKKIKEVINYVNDYLLNHFNIEYFFKSFKVLVIDKEIKREVSKEEFNAAYFQRLIKLTMDRQEKENYKDSISFWKKFYLINTLSLLKHIKVSGIDVLLQEQKEQYINKLDEFSLDTLIHNELDINEQLIHIF